MEILLNLQQSNKKGQAALEFYMYAAALVLFIGIISLIFLNMGFDESEQREIELVYEIGGSYADMINFALVAGDGFQGKFYVPKEINNMPYKASFGNELTSQVSGFVTIEYQGSKGIRTYSYPLNTKNISGDLVINPLSIVDHILLNNTNGTTYIQVN
jgi:uncharacterized protein (UPF0333 family)